MVVDIYEFIISYKPRFIYSLLLLIISIKMYLTYTNGGISSVGLEYQIVILRVIGSNPIFHPYDNNLFILLKASSNIFSDVA